MLRSTHVCRSAPDSKLPKVTHPFSKKIVIINRTHFSPLSISIKFIISMPLKTNRKEVDNTTKSRIIVMWRAGLSGKEIGKISSS